VIEYSSQGKVRKGEKMGALSRRLEGEIGLPLLYIEELIEEKRGEGI